jgi:hypothetical protein
VILVLPDHRHLCLRHDIWLGSTGPKSNQPPEPPGPVDVQVLPVGCLLASVGDVFAYCGDRFSGEAFEYIPLVAGQDEGADAVLEGHLG